MKRSQKILHPKESNSLAKNRIRNYQPTKQTDRTGKYLSNHQQKIQAHHKNPQRGKALRELQAENTCSPKPVMDTQHHHEKQQKKIPDGEHLLSRTDSFSNNVLIEQNESADQYDEINHHSRREPPAQDQVQAIDLNLKAGGLSESSNELYSCEPQSLGNTDLAFKESQFLQSSVGNEDKAIESNLIVNMCMDPDFTEVLEQTIQRSFSETQMKQVLNFSEMDIENTESAQGNIDEEHGPRTIQSNKTKYMPANSNWADGQQYVGVGKQQSTPTLPAYNQELSHRNKAEQCQNVGTFHNSQVANQNQNQVLLNEKYNEVFNSLKFERLNQDLDITEEMLSDINKQIEATNSEAANHCGALQNLYHRGFNSTAQAPESPIQRNSSNLQNTFVGASQSQILPDMELQEIIQEELESTYDEEHLKKQRRKENNQIRKLRRKTQQTLDKKRNSSYSNNSRKRKEIQLQ